jgi:hypothetical protein
MTASSLIQQCIDMLKQKDIQAECKRLFSPALECILLEIAPLLYTVLAVLIILVVLMFVNIAFVIFVYRRLMAENFSH